jgi:hypothetical protein
LNDFISSKFGGGKANLAGILIVLLQLPPPGPEVTEVEEEDPFSDGARTAAELVHILRKQDEKCCF